MGWRNWGQAGTALALIVTFLISGVWHGANWGFVIWGLVHGVYLASSTYYRPYQKQLHRWLKIEKSAVLKWWQVFVTFNLVSFAWVFFRANSLEDAMYFVSNLISLQSLKTLRQLLFSNGNEELSVLIVIMCLMAFKVKLSLGERIRDIPEYFRYVLFWAVVFGIIFYGKLFSNSTFIYQAF
jgi:D-alanyl-lipoteichoic acid acyltransferase DltB (MBOAT superfamily)